MINMKVGIDSLAVTQGTRNALQVKLVLVTESFSGKSVHECSTRVVNALLLHSSGFRMVGFGQRTVRAPGARTKDSVLCSLVFESRK